MDYGEAARMIRKLYASRIDAYGLETTDGYKAIRQPLTDDLIKAHVAGSRRIGVYPIQAGNVVQWSAFDFDVAPDQADKAYELLKDSIEKVYAKSVEYGLFPHITTSKKRGYHTSFFFDGPVPAKDVRRLMAVILKETGTTAEIFPKQDAVSRNGAANGLGNFLWLPLHGQSVKHGRTVFLNTSFEPYENQWEYLRKVQLTRAEDVRRLAGVCQEEPERILPQDEPAGSSMLDVPKYLEHYRIEYKVKADSTRTFFLLRKCLFADQHTTRDTTGDSAIIQGADGKLTYQCFHGHCQGKTWKDAKQAISGEASLDQFWKGERPHNRNLVENLRVYVDNAFNTFNTEQIYRDLGISNPKDKAHIRTELHRMVEKGTIERGRVNGSFTKLELRADEIRINAVVPAPLPVILPGEIQRLVDIYRKNLLVGAGSSNGGKTAYGLNCAWENRDRFDVRYFTTEMDSDELTLRIHNFGYQITEWEKVKFRNWESCHSIQPDALNILDYLEVREGEFWRVGDDLRKIFEKLQAGIALVFIQMDRGRQFGWGGQKTVDKARLYFTLDDNKLTIVKGKNWSSGENPNGKSISFSLHNGSIFRWGSWS